MTVQLIPPKSQFIYDDEAVVSGKVYTYEAGTSTPKTTWKDQTKAAANTNPVILNAQGQADIWIEGAYKVVVKDSLDVQLYTVDNIIGYDARDWTGLTATIDELNATDTSTLSKNATYTLDTPDRGKTILADVTTGDVDINLLDATTATDGFIITIKKIDTSTNKVNIKADGSETIDSVSTFILYDVDDFIKIVCDGSNWKIIAAQIRGTTISKSATDTITFDDNTRTYVVDASGGTVDINLLASTTVGRGFKLSVKKTDSSTNVVTIKAAGAETIDGQSTLEVTTQYESVSLINDGAEWFITDEYGASSPRSNPFPRNYIDGFVISNDVTDVDHDINIATGVARDIADSLNVILASIMLKKFDVNWVEGTGNGGFATGATRASGSPFHVFVIAKPDGTVDAGFDDDVNATNLLADATAYTKYRRIGSIYSQSSDSLKVLELYQVGDYFRHAEPELDVDVTNPGTTAVLNTLKIPADVVVKVTVNAFLQNAGGEAACYLSSPSVTDLSPSQTVSPLANLYNAAPKSGMSQVEIISNTSRQIRSRLDVSVGTNLRIATVGWKDFRGTDL